MPFIEINGAKIFYQTFGTDHPGKAPIILIHGSTITGQEDWGVVAPLLAQQYHVIVPDCRGHGQSSNPTLSYSFKEMANDVAALVHALGYTRAHIIGHSNGGNVALVTLLEHPEIIQSAIPQAANAYVSQDLIDKEPQIFDPDRVQRESPTWMEEMIRLHGPFHGKDYWRDLLRLTVQAIITEPNYTPADLARVERPVLIIQGENDPVNAPAHHAEFMADNIPYAELWLPAQVGHNVHVEATLSWVQRVLDFLARRGTDAGEALHRLKQTQFADERDTVFQPEAKMGADGIRTSGQVLTAENANAARQAIINAVPEGAPIQDTLHILLTAESPWALIRRGVTDLRREPRNLGERISQALLGETVRVLTLNESPNEWAFIRTENDSYIGWVHQQALHLCSSNEAESYRAACNAIVVAELAVVHGVLPGESQQASNGLPPKVPGKLPFGTRLAVVSAGGAWLEVRLPDGKQAWLQRGDVIFDSQRPHCDAAGIQATLALIRRFVGTPYLWGGRTPFGYDCSGLAQTFYAFMGIQIPRDADQQFRLGQPVTGTPLPGDLLFFGNNQGRATQRYAAVTHVAISLGDWKIIHANGTAWGVSFDDLSDENLAYSGWLREHHLGTRRFGQGAR
jgi:pimeloyl-ACP methyl ester carboxylesterase/cell wall-associated NlpC family hydrolase